MIQTSNIANGIQTSFTRQLFNMAKEYDDVIDFTLGDPDVQTHPAIKAAACRAIEQGKTRYSQNAGLLELRQTIAKYYHRKEQLAYRPEDEIMVTVGAMEGLYLCLLAMLNPDDEVIIPDALAFPKEDVIVPLLRSVGFKNVKVRKFTFGVCVLYVASK